MNKPDPRAEDELQKILEKLVHTRENYEMLPEYDTAIEEAQKAINAYTTNKIIERLEVIKATDITRWVTNPSGMAGISFNVIDEAIAELRKTL